MPFIYTYIIISESKTKVMNQPAPGTDCVHPAVHFQGKLLRVFDHFLYFGSTISEHNLWYREICFMMEKIARYFALREKIFWSQRDIKILSRLAKNRASIIPELFSMSLNLFCVQKTYQIP